MTALTEHKNLCEIVVILKGILRELEVKKLDYKLKVLSGIELLVNDYSNELRMLKGFVSKLTARQCIDLLFKIATKHYTVFDDFGIIHHTDLKNQLPRLMRLIELKADCPKEKLELKLIHGGLTEKNLNQDLQNHRG